MDLNRTPERRISRRRCARRLTTPGFLDGDGEAPAEPGVQQLVYLAFVDALEHPAAEPAAAADVASAGPAVA